MRSLSNSKASAEFNMGTFFWLQNVSDELAAIEDETILIERRDFAKQGDLLYIKLRGLTNRRSKD
jgi:hypothetical protein